MCLAFYFHESGNTEKKESVDQVKELLAGEEGYVTKLSDLWNEYALRYKSNNKCFADVSLTEIKYIIYYYLREGIVDVEDKNNAIDISEIIYVCSMLASDREDYKDFIDWCDDVVVNSESFKCSLGSGIGGKLSRIQVFVRIMKNLPKGWSLASGLDIKKNSARNLRFIIPQRDYDNTKTRINGFLDKFKNANKPDYFNLIVVDSVRCSKRQKIMPNQVSDLEDMKIETGRKQYSSLPCIKAKIDNGVLLIGVDSLQGDTSFDHCITNPKKNKVHFHKEHLLPLVEHALRNNMPIYFEGGYNKTVINQLAEIYIQAVINILSGQPDFKTKFITNLLGVEEQRNASEDTDLNTQRKRLIYFHGQVKDRLKDNDKLSAAIDFTIIDHKPRKEAMHDYDIDFGDTFIAPGEDDNTHGIPFTWYQNNIIPKLEEIQSGADKATISDSVNEIIKCLDLYFNDIHSCVGNEDNQRYAWKAKESFNLMKKMHVKLKDGEAKLFGLDPATKSIDYINYSIRAMMFYHDKAEVDGEVMWPRHTLLKQLFFDYAGFGQGSGSTFINGEPDHHGSDQSNGFCRPWAFSVISKILDVKHRKDNSLNPGAFVPVPIVVTDVDINQTNGTFATWINFVLLHVQKTGDEYTKDDLRQGLETVKKEYGVSGIIIVDAQNQYMYPFPYTRGYASVEDILKQINQNSDLSEYGLVSGWKDTEGEIDDNPTQNNTSKIKELEYYLGLKLCVVEMSSKATACDKYSDILQNLVAHGASASSPALCDQKMNDAFKVGQKEPRSLSPHDTSLPSSTESRHTINEPERYLGCEPYRSVLFRSSIDSTSLQLIVHDLSEAQLKYYYKDSQGLGTVDKKAYAYNLCFKYKERGYVQSIDYFATTNVNALYVSVLNTLFNRNPTCVSPPISEINIKKAIENLNKYNPSPRIYCRVLHAIILLVRAAIHDCSSVSVQIKFLRELRSACAPYVSHGRPYSKFLETGYIY